MSEWREATLGEITDIAWGDTSTTKASYVNEGFTAFSASGPDGFLPKADHHTPGVVISAIGAQCGKTWFARGSWSCIKNTMWFRARDGHSTRYLFYATATADFWPRRGAAQPFIALGDARKISVRVPDLETQMAIAEILSAIDDLIENNRRRIEVLEEMAQAIYREWFVHFRYPGHEDATFVDSALGPIPEGWEVGALGQIASVNPGARKPSDDEIIRYLDISSLGDRWLDTPPEIGGESAPGRARRRVKPGDVVWSMVRPNRRAHALLVEPGQDWIASTGLAVLTPRSVASGFLFETVSSPDFSDYLVSQEGGSAYPAVKPKDFETAPLVRPPSDVESAFSAAVEPMHRQAWALRLMCDRLAELRDLLLPKLVTGEIDVSAIDLDALVGTVS